MLPPYPPDIPSQRGEGPVVPVFFLLGETIWFGIVFHNKPLHCGFVIELPIIVPFPNTHTLHTAPRNTV